MSFVGNVIGFEGFHGKRIGEALLKDPSRLITGVDPASTWAWNGVLGTHNHPLVDQMGGATGETYKAASDSGINTHDGRMMQNLAHAVAAFYGAAGIAGAAGGGAASGAGGAGGEAGGAGAADVDPALFGDAIDAGGGWSPASASAAPYEAAPYVNVAQDSQLANSQLGLGPVTSDDTVPGWWNSTNAQKLGQALMRMGGNNQGQSAGAGFDWQNASNSERAGQVFSQLGSSLQQQAQAGGGRMLPVNMQPGNVPWNFMGGN